ncbi:hypothetical protein ILYODFUR_022337 [Ilyodon furcidens]|uniref:Attractin GBD domain-containing protein n=1 Tax=Ilyodon furcidens TaxID=33524 RepID=A0ABV0TNL2_9TELE
MSIIARTNIKEHKNSFSCEKFNFRLHHNITFYVYVSNFSWPIKIQKDHNETLKIKMANFEFSSVSFSAEHTPLLEHQTVYSERCFGKSTITFNDL